MCGDRESSGMMVTGRSWVCASDSPPEAATPWKCPSILNECSFNMNFIEDHWEVCSEWAFKSGPVRFSSTVSFLVFVDDGCAGPGSAFLSK